MGAISEPVQASSALVDLLESWAEWQRSYRPAIGFPSRSCGVESGYAGMASAGFGDLLDGCEQTIYRTIDSTLDDLGRQHPARQAAIQRRYLRVAWRFPRENYPGLLAEAHDWLSVVLRRRGVVL